MVMELSAMLAHELNLRATQVEATIALLDAGNTLPFIARYRKETLRATRWTKNSCAVCLIGSRIFAN